MPSGRKRQRLGCCKAKCHPTGRKEMKKTIRLHKRSLSSQSFPQFRDSVSSPYLEQSNKESCRNQERHDAADEPAEPQGSCAKTHNPHGFLQSRLLLVHHAFNDHGHRVDPGQSHEERQRAVQHPEETVGQWSGEERSEPSFGLTSCGRIIFN